VNIKRSDDESRKARDAAIAAIEANTSPPWTSWAKAAVEAVAHRGHDFISDEVWELLSEWGVEPPHDNRAMGPVMRSFVRSGYLIVVGFKESDMVSCHRRPKRIYRRAG
jgi:hypothetical protein